MLIGMSGVGKSTLGKMLATYLNWTFVDVDKLISEGEHLSIQALIDKHGDKGVFGY